MTKKEFNAVIEWANGLSDEDLEDAYYEAVYDSLGTLTEKMFDLDYDVRDIKERAQYEKFLCEKASVLESLCEERGIVLWNRPSDNS